MFRAVSRLAGLREVVLGLLDTILGNTSSDEGSNNGLLESVINLINNPDTGGLPGLIAKFNNNGLGDIVSSWVGTGANQAVSADQLTNTLGMDRISQIAMSPDPIYLVLS